MTHRPAEPATFPSRLDRVRGMLLGIAVGDAVGATGAPTPGTADPVRPGTATQLTCFTVDGVIRASVRGAGKGICHPPSVVWHAYCRWAALQGIDTDRLRAHWRPEPAADGGQRWPDGWLAHVPQLRQRRGTAPATVAAVRGQRMGTLEKPVGDSNGCHAMVRALPVGAVTWPSAPQLAAEVAALTHGHPDAAVTASHGAVLVRSALAAGTVPDALQAGQAELRRLPGIAGHVMTVLADAVQAGTSQPGDRNVLARHAPDRTGLAALAGGLYTAASFPLPGQFRHAVLFASTAPDGDAVAAVTGALLGAVHGVHELPVDWVARLELGWVLDTLAHDLHIEFTECPADPDHDDLPRQFAWVARYPGW